MAMLSRIRFRSPATIGWLCVAVTSLSVAIALGVWAVITITKAGSNVPTNRPTTTIVEQGPYHRTRNPIYLGMFLVGRI